MSHGKQGETYLPAPPVHQLKEKSEARRGRGNASAPYSLHTTTTTPVSLPRLPRLHLRSPSSPLISVMTGISLEKPRPLGNSDIVSGGPWTADNSPSHGLLLPDCHNLGGSRACHAPCTWVVSSWMINDSPLLTLA